VTTRHDPARRKRRAAVDAAMIFVVVLLVVQMWLLTATLESYLAGHADVALPAMLLSGLLCLTCVVLYRFVVRLDRTPAPADELSAHGPWEIGRGRT
jgi:hypothetical protein